MTKVTCGCACHRPIGEKDRASVPVDDVLEAAVACPKCRDYHAAVFSTYKPPTHWSPESDATGGEGAE